MVVQLLQVRKILESWAAAEAARLATEEDLKNLEEVCRDLEHDFRDNELGVDADVRFHLSIYQAARNTVLCHIASTLLTLLHQAQRVTRQVMFEETINRERLLQQHGAIFDAIRERNPDRAGEAMRTHLDYAENYFISRWAGSAPARTVENEPGKETLSSGRLWTNGNEGPPERRPPERS